MPCVDAVLAIVGQLLAFVSLAFADLRVNLTLVGQARAVFTRRPGVREGPPARRAGR